MTDEPRDTREEYSPRSLVLDVRRTLARAGIGTEPDENQLYVATIAAADLLRALGVRPTGLPRY